MEKIIVLGTAGAVVDGARDNVSLVYHTENIDVLLECGGSAAHKLARCGIRYEQLAHIILTHTHLDHIYGLPGLLFAMRYRDLARTAPVNLYCPAPAQHFIETFVDALALRDDKMLPLKIIGIPLVEDALVYADAHVRITATPVVHALKHPTCAIKIISQNSGKTVVYSADTTYSEALIRLARDADWLFHECSGLPNPLIPPIHSDARQVGEVARQSGARQLVLLHLDTVLNDAPAAILAEVRRYYAGAVTIAADFDEYQIA